MSRWVVIFSSHPAPPADRTMFDVTASSALKAISETKAHHIPHPWSIVEVKPWPRGAKNIDAVAEKMRKTS